MVGPLQVLQHDQGRALASERFEEALRRGEQQLTALHHLFGQPREDRQADCHALGVLAGEQSFQAIDELRARRPCVVVGEDAARFRDQLRKRAIRRALPVRQRAAAQDQAALLLPDAAGELACQT